MVIDYWNIGYFVFIVSYAVILNSCYYNLNVEKCLSSYSIYYYRDCLIWII